MIGHFCGLIILKKIKSIGKECEQLFVGAEHFN